MAIRVSREINGKTLSIEAGKMAKLTNGAVMVEYGETAVLCTATMDDARPGINFFPLTCDYREKTSAAGKIPGGFFKREGRPTDKEILTMRVIDRPTRPLFPDGFRKDIQIQCMVLSADDENEPDVLAMLGASAALAISDIPWNGPTASVRIGLVKNKYVVNPTFADMDESGLNLIVAGTKHAITMVEAGAQELSEDQVIEGLETAQKAIIDLVDMIEELTEKIGKEKVEYVPEPPSEHFKAVSKWLEKGMQKALSVPAKKNRQAAVSELKDAMLDKFLPDPEERDALKGEFGEIFYQTMHVVARKMLKAGKRMDGRGMADVRPITSEVGLLPRTHGSSLFTRGETQALATVTLGTTADKQIIDGLRDEVKKGFLLHYNFPSFSVGECRPIRGPGRREIGHGALAERAIAAMLPEPEKFPYTIRIVSDILESNGSSSMATVCGGSLALMDAGVRLKRPVAGIAMGLLKEDDDFIVLSDILGDEDHHGDMDFKVAGTEKGITALQMDIKIDGVTREVLSRAMEQAKDGRLHILKEMKKALAQPRKQLSRYAPRFVTLKINPEKIGALIGPGGKTVRKLQEETGAKIEIVDEAGNVAIYAQSEDSLVAAKRQVELLTAEAEVGKVYQGRVQSIKDFGAFIEVIPGQDGLLHISDMGDGYVSRVSDIYKPGDEVEVRVEDINDFGKIRLVLTKSGAAAGGSGGGEARDGDGRDDDRESRGRGRGRKRDDRKPRGRRDEQPAEEEEEEDLVEEEEVFEDDADDFDADEEAFDDDEEAFEDDDEAEAEAEVEEAPRHADRGGRRGRGGRRDRGRDDDRGERGGRGDRGGRGGRGRGSRGGRPSRDDDRPQREERGDRGDRGGRRGGGRDDDRGGRGRGRDDHGDRRPRGGRGDDRPERGERSDRGERGDRSDRSDRSERGDRGGRGGRGGRRGGRDDDRGGRRDRDDRAPRGERRDRDGGRDRDDAPRDRGGDEGSRSRGGGRRRRSSRR